MAETETLDGRTVHIQLNSSGLYPLVVACKDIDQRIKTSQFVGEQGSVRVGDRGLEVSYARTNGGYLVEIFHRGDKEQADKLYQLILKHYPKEDDV